MAMRFRTDKSPPFIINGSGSSTVFTRLIDSHYVIRGDFKKWRDLKRVDALCGLLRVTRDELASMLMIPHKTFAMYCDQVRFPGPVCLLLTFLEQYFGGEMAPDRIEGVTPAVNLLLSRARSESDEILNRRCPTCAQRLMGGPHG